MPSSVTPAVKLDPGGGGLCGLWPCGLVWHGPPSLLPSILAWLEEAGPELL